jgi:hypothetical protein
MSYNSKYTGKQVDDLLDQVEGLSNIDLSEYVTAEDAGEEIDGVESPFVTKAELDLAISEAITTTLNTEV